MGKALYALTRYTTYSSLDPNKSRTHESPFIPSQMIRHLPSELMPAAAKNVLGELKVEAM